MSVPEDTMSEQERPGSETPAAFYRQLDDHRFASSGHTAGPWSPQAQHFGPPAALLTRALERVPRERDMMLARITVEILGPVPLAELTVHATLQRPGRSVELLAAELESDGRPVATARAWRIATGDSSSVAAGETPALAPVDDAAPQGRPPGWGAGYLDAIEWRLLAGGFNVPGATAVWARQRVPLVEGEDPSPVQRLLAIADSGNGAAARLDPRAWYFINSELTVHLHREPVGEWIGLDADSVLGPHGIGTAASVLHDEQGPVGRGAQALLVRHRGPAA